MMDTQQQRAAVYGRQSSGKAKSIAEQIAECTADVHEQGWTVSETYQDGSSASRYARRTRDAWSRLLADLNAGAFDVLVLWESSRGDRDLPTWAGLLATCRERGVRIRVTSHGRTYDLGNGRDWRSLADDGVDSAYESEKLSVRVRRGVAAAAAGGRPAMGPCPYGYRRTYDPRTGALLGQEPDPDTAPIVKEIIDAISRAVPVSAVADDLNARGVAPPAGLRWYRQRVREVALNPAYIGRRRHRGTTHPGGWLPLVDDATYYAAVRVLSEPGRLAKARPGRQIHLLTYLAECVNGHPLRARATYYTCAPGCTQVRRAALDAFITEVVLARLAEPDAYESLHQSGENADREVLAARGEAARLRTELDTWRLSAARGQTTPDSLAVVEAELRERIGEADDRAARAAAPPALRQLLGPAGDVAARWAAAPLAARREVIRTLMTVVVWPSGHNAYTAVEDRVVIDWRAS